MSLLVLVRLRCNRLAVSVFLASLPMLATAHEFELPFWPTPGAEKDPRVLRTEEGACGNVVIAKVRVMPNPGSGDVLAVDVVFELSARSRVLRRWYLPANTLPIATNGDELVFSHNHETYAVTTVGAIRALSLERPLPASREVKCRMPNYFNNSGYARCHAFPRINSEQKSTLAFQGPCT